jgi:hypothetical protein
VRKVFLSSVCLVLLLTFAGFIWWDYGAKTAVAQLLVRSSEQALSQSVTFSDIELDIDLGELRLATVAARTIGDPKPQGNFRAREVILSVDIDSAFYRRLLVTRGDVYNADVVMEYIAPGVSNFNIIEAHFQEYLAIRRAEGKEKLQWDVDDVVFHDSRFRLIDFDGTVVADVSASKLRVSSLGNDKSGRENRAEFFSGLQVSLLKQVLMGKVEGRYDKSAIIAFVKREHRNLLRQVDFNSALKKGRNLLDFFRK